MSVMSFAYWKLLFNIKTDNDANTPIITKNGVDYCVLRHQNEEDEGEPLCIRKGSELIPRDHDSQTYTRRMQSFREKAGMNSLPLNAHGEVLLPTGCVSNAMTNVLALKYACTWTPSVNNDEQLSYLASSSVSPCHGNPQYYDESSSSQE